MEVMGGASFMDGDWESICKILSFDQDSEIGLLMGNSNPSTSQCELEFPFNHTNQLLLPTPFSNNLFQLSCGSDLSIGFNHGSLINDDDQISSLTSSSSLGNHSMKRKHDDQAEIPASKKRACSTNNRKTIKARNKKDEEEQKPSSDTSDNESNGSHDVINEEAKETPKLNGKRRANRGAATDPQSLYARKRRERINERLRILQNLVPNGTKVDISTMLEEAVSYVKFLQMQIKLLSSDDMWMYAPLAYNGFDVGV